MRLFKKKCYYCNKKIGRGKEISVEVKIPEFIDPKIKSFCSGEHFEKYILENPGTKSKKPYCMNCDD